jgi:putative membrane protein
MNHAAMIAVSSIALALAGCGSDPAAGPTDAATADPLETLGAVPDTRASMSSPTQSGPQMFADAAAASDRFEIEMSKLAETRVQSPAVKRFASQMIDAHTASTAKLMAAAAKASGGITPAPRMSAMQQQTLESLSALSGAEFDAAFARAQVGAHEAALQVLESYAASGSDASLQAFAREMAPQVKGHLEMARKLK